MQDWAHLPLPARPQAAPVAQGLRFQGDVTQRIHVMEFVTSFHLGGTERQFVNLVKGLQGSRFQVHVACFDGIGMYRRELGPDVPVHEISIKSFYSLGAARALLSLASYLRRNHIEIVHATGLYPNVFGVPAARLAGTPVIIASVRDMGSMWSAHQLRMQRLACSLAQAVVTNARAIGNRLCAEGYDPARIEIIPNGIEAPPVPASRGQLRQSLGIPASAPLVGVLTRLDPVKGIEDFLDAAAKLAPLHPDARFVVIGGPPSPAQEPYAQTLRDRTAALGIADRTTFTGLRSDARSLLPELTVCVQPSHTEGLSNALLEAMAAGRPVVATSVGGNPEVVVHGVTGLLVPAMDPDALAGAVSQLLEAPLAAAAMGQAGRARVDTLYTCERMLERTTGLYMRLLRRAHSERALREGSSLEARPGTP